MQDTKLPLTVWFLALHLLTQSKRRRSAANGRMAGLKPTRKLRR